MQYWVTFHQLLVYTWLSSRFWCIFFLAHLDTILWVRVSKTDLIFSFKEDQGVRKRNKTAVHHPLV